jgi:hypothetical protein
MNDYHDLCLISLFYHQVHLVFCVFLTAGNARACCAHQRRSLLVAWFIESLFTRDSISFMFGIHSFRYLFTSHAHSFLRPKVCLHHPEVVTTFGGFSLLDICSLSLSFSSLSVSPTSSHVWVLQVEPSWAYKSELREWAYKSKPSFMQNFCLERAKRSWIVLSDSGVFLRRSFPRSSAPRTKHHVCLSRVHSLWYSLTIWSLNRSRGPFKAAHEWLIAKFWGAMWQ